jgi:hypothetical protein
MSWNKSPRREKAFTSSETNMRVPSARRPLRRLFYIPLDDNSAGR